jgi:hypothetical protein
MMSKVQKQKPLPAARDLPEGYDPNNFSYEFGGIKFVMDGGTLKTTVTRPGDRFGQVTQHYDFEYSGSVLYVCVRRKALELFIGDHPATR